MTGAEIKLTFLGTGSAIPPNGMRQSCTAIRHKQGLLLLDCGEGSQYALREYGISTRKQFCIWISHLHSDHFLGLPGLLASLELLGRDEPVLIIGPVGLKQTVQNLLIANYVNASYEIRVFELQPGDTFQGDGYILKTIKAIHEANALSVKFEENPFKGKVNIEKLQNLGVKPGPQISKLQGGATILLDGREIKPEEVIGPTRKGRSICYTGDTALNEALYSWIAQCDVLIHEATYPSDMKELAAERNHSTIDQAAMVASKSDVKHLILTHLSPRIHDITAEIKKAEKIFPQIILAKEGEEFDLPYPYHEN